LAVLGLWKAATAFRSAVRRSRQKSTTRTFISRDEGAAQVSISEQKGRSDMGWYGPAVHGVSAVVEWPGPGNLPNVEGIGWTDTEENAHVRLHDHH
jgi:hypothetical protein